jgi:hypothetical protein
MTRSVLPRFAFVLVLAALSLLGCDSASSTGARPSPAASRLDPSKFVAQVDSPWYPLKLGTRYVYIGVKDGH